MAAFRVEIFLSRLRSTSWARMRPLQIAMITFRVQRLPFDNGPNQRIDIGFPDSG